MTWADSDLHAKYNTQWAHKENAPEEETLNENQNPRSVDKSDLHRISAAQIHRAGPRYAPSLDPNAPNLPVESVLLPIRALAGDEYFANHVRGLRSDLLATFDRRGPIIRKYFRGVKSTPDALADALANLAAAPPGERLGPSRLVARLSRRTQSSLARRARSFYKKDLTSLEEDAQRRIENERWEVQHLMDSLEPVIEFTASPAFSSITSNRLLLLGDWGTGKTHLLCDVTKSRMARDLPTLLYLAKELPRNVEPLQALCDTTGIAASPRELLQVLQELGERSGTTSLLIVDGINEGDRAQWRKTVARLAKTARVFTHVGVLLSCRRPFDLQILGERSRSQWVEINHPGFAGAEFDAQLEFFSYYDIPAPDVPLLTPEFSRPLFLRLMCESIKGLSQRSKSNYLRSVASGQKGMTKVFEDFVKKVAVDIEDSFGLQRGLCWRLLKGQRVGGNVVGVAPVMADTGGDSIIKDRCLRVITQVTSWADIGRCGELLERLIFGGLLLEQLRWDGSNYVEEIELPYQRFSDHLIARHLLERHLDTTDEATIRRSFYINRPLGRIFGVSWGDTFEQPGLAAAVMVEFPERVKRVQLPNKEREVVFYLPKKRRLSYPLKSVFLEGLYWRSTDSFSPGTDRVMSVYLDPTGPEADPDALEVVTALATRPDHPWSPVRLTSYLAKKTMADRVLSWSEYLRNADSDSVLYRIMEWVERRDGLLDENLAGRYLALLPLLLTTSKRDLRDRATRSLFLIGGRYPSMLFDNALVFLGFPDPYVPERVLAACYGVAMSFWADPQGAHVRQALPEFARDLYGRLFVPDAQQSIAHVLLQDYALGVIELALRVAPRTLKGEQLSDIRRPLKCVKSPFPAAQMVTDAEFDKVDSAFAMDFENYTLDRLVEGRGNYDYDHEEYSAIRRQIRWRVGDLGFTHDRFREVDGIISGMSRHSRGQRAKVERYGKKYSWIAFFEMYGVRLSRGVLPEWRREQWPSDIDIDPSFPLPPRTWMPDLHDPFVQSPVDVIDWVANGPVPDYENLLRLVQIDWAPGSWLLLDGYVEHSREDDDRSVFTFLRGLLTTESTLQQILTEYHGLPYPGNHAIPEPSMEVLTFAGEIPWSKRFAHELRSEDGVANPQVDRAFKAYGDPSRRGVQVELPVVTYLWESSHDSVVNDVTNAMIPSPALCERLGLVNHSRQFDLYDRCGRPASISISRKHGGVTAHLFYIREDLLNQYGSETMQSLCWLVWGERTPNPALFRDGGIEVPRDIYSNYQHIHKRSYVWTGREVKRPR